MTFMIIFQDVNLLMKMSILMKEMKIMTLQVTGNPIEQKQDILVMKDGPYDHIKKLSRDTKFLMFMLKKKKVEM